MYKAVIFDIGNVIAYDVWEHLLLDEAYESISKKAGVAPKYGLPKDLIEKLGKEIFAEYDLRKAKDESEVLEFEKEYWQKFIDRAGLKETASVDNLMNMTDDFIQEVDGTIQILEKLKGRNIGLGICSNNCEFWFIRQWEKLRLNRFFSKENVILSCHYGFRKPDKRIYQETAKSLRVNMKDCIFVDDRKENIKSANDYGMVGILFVDASQLEAELRNLKMI